MNLNYKKKKFKEYTTHKIKEKWLKNPSKLFGI